VDVKREERESADEQPSRSAERGRNGGDDEAPEQVVSQRMMVFRPPEHWMGRVARRQLEREAEAVRIWSEAGDDDRASLPRADVRDRLGNAPAQQGVSDRVHFRDPLNGAALGRIGMSAESDRATIRMAGGTRTTELGRINAAIVPPSCTSIANVVDGAPRGGA